MAGKTAAPWEIPYSEPLDEPKGWPSLQKEQSERITALMKERFLTVSEHVSSFTAASGELVKATGAITVTLPTPTANTTIGVVANGHNVEITAGSNKIKGGNLEASSVKLTGQEQAILQADGSNYYITSGLAEGIIGETALGSESVTNGKVKNATLKLTEKSVAESLETATIKNENVTGAKIAKETIAKAKLEKAVQEELWNPKGTYSARVELAAGTEYEISSTRPSFVYLEGSQKGPGGGLEVTVGGQTLGGPSTGFTGINTYGWGFIVPAGQKFKVEGSGFNQVFATHVVF